MKHLTRVSGARSMAILLIALAGCASMTAGPGANGANANAASTPMPMVQNCAVVNIGSPSKFACDGKVYTTFELAKIREQAAKKAAAGN